jgi:hypothetical protein
MRFVPIRSYDNYIPAHIAMGRLKDAFINCYLENENSVTIDPFLSNAIGGIKLMVAETQAEQAVALLDADDKQTDHSSAFPS